MALTILIASAECAPRDAFAGQLAADGHDVHQAGHSERAKDVLAKRHVDALVLGALERPAGALELLRSLRAPTSGPHAWSELATITLAPLVGDDELDALRAYEAGSDHHLPAGAGYLHLRAVLQAVVARRQGASAPRVRRVGAIEIDTAAREVRVAGARVELSAMEFALLNRLASDPRRVFSKEELLRDVWGYRSPGRTRTLDSHAGRLRRKFAGHGAQAVVNVWGVGYRFSDQERARA